MSVGEYQYDNGLDSNSEHIAHYPSEQDCGAVYRGREHLREKSRSDVVNDRSSGLECAGERVLKDDSRSSEYSVVHSSKQCPEFAEQLSEQQEEDDWLEK